jgi:hypothetical protein
MRQALKCFLIWAGCVITLEVFCFGAFGLGGVAHRISLSRSWRVSTGTIVAVDRNNHNSITVLYPVEGRPIERTFTRSERDVGENVTVYYSPIDPTNADIENPAVSLRNDLRFLFLAGLGLGTFASIFINFRIAAEALARPWTMFRLTPRFAVGWMAIAVLIGSVSSLGSSAEERPAWLSRALVLCGTAFLCVQAFRTASASWSLFLRSRMFIVGAFFIVVGQLISWRIFVR